LIGSYFNLPITVLPGPPVRSGQIVDFFGMRYVVPFVVSPSTILAVKCRRCGDSDIDVRLSRASLSALAQGSDRCRRNRLHCSFHGDASGW